MPPAMPGGVGAKSFSKQNGGKERKTVLDNMTTTVYIKIERDRYERFKNSRISKMV